MWFTKRQIRFIWFGIMLSNKRVNESGCHLYGRISVYKLSLCRLVESLSNLKVVYYPLQ